LLRAIIAKVEASELTASKRLIARLEGSAVAVEALARRSRSSR
jgi:hypothetical protein